jgi:serine/threonine protein kinase
LNFAHLERVDEYEIVDQLGAGGQSVVFRARHRVMNRLVALKFLRPEFSGDPTANRFFRVEIEVSAMLTHARILRAYDAKEFEGVPYLVMELREGQDLAAVRRQRTLSLDEILASLRDAAAGLSFAHARGIVHRDIKPANLFLTSDNETLVFDWGLAKFPRLDDPGSAPRPGRPAPAGEAASSTEGYQALDTHHPAESPSQPRAEVGSLGTIVPPVWSRIGGQSRLDATMAVTLSRPPSLGVERTARSISWAGHIIGTPAFMAPEQAKSSNVDQRADIYSLGATLFHLLAGKTMFDGHIRSVIHRKLKGEIPALASACEGIPKEIEAVYQRMVAFDPNERYQAMD